MKVSRIVRKDRVVYVAAGRMFGSYKMARDYAIAVQRDAESRDEAAS